ncbi:hypothetical protein EDD37DRAFT_217748 [Exophiala viscosa]|uniref:uncharacterized protein n=1 Tax=Exophiala viscosa TaxID=2486360 RepID=UPI00218D4BC5|nr:hypothetical protein EDD37DRAFT_217748 [Exophiala viscosa]
MASATTEEKLSYVMTVLMHTDMGKPDYRGVAEELGINTAGNAQRRFRSIVKSAGFDLVKDRIVSDSGSGNAASTGDTPSPAKKSGGKASAGAEAKKTPAKKTTAVPATNKKRKIAASAGNAGTDEEQDVIEKVKEERETTPAAGENSLGD